MREINAYDSVWREFENVHLVYQLTISSSCFAQLKRHRMATIITQDYDPSIGISVPGSVRKARRVGLLREAAARAAAVVASLIHLFWRRMAEVPE